MWHPDMQVFGNIFKQEKQIKVNPCPKKGRCSQNERNATSSKDAEKLDDKVDWEEPPNVKQAIRSK